MRCCSRPNCGSQPKSGSQKFFWKHEFLSFILVSL